MRTETAFKQSVSLKFPFCSEKIDNINSGDKPSISLMRESLMLVLSWIFQVG